MGLRNWIYEKTGIKLKKFNYPFNLVEIATKKNSLENAKNIEILAIGSSHGAYSFNSSVINRSFNLCTTSQDLYYSNKLYDYTIYSHKKLKKVIIYFSVFSNGYDVSKTSLKEICVFFKNFFDINYQHEDIELNQIYNKYNNIKSLEFLKAIDGYIEPVNFIKNRDIELRTSKHLRESEREPNQLHNLINLINKCKKNSHELIIVIPPARSDYKKFVDRNVFNKIKEIAKNYNLKLIDFFECEAFNDDDFGDSDHTNKKGAIKLTKLLNKNMF